MKILGVDELLDLPFSTNSYLVIRDSLYYYRDIKLYRKLICEYLDQLPLFEIENIIVLANIMLCDDEYLLILDMIFLH